MRKILAKKTILALSAVLVSILMMSSVSAVQHVNSNIIVDNLDNSEESDQDWVDASVNATRTNRLISTSRTFFEENNLLATLFDESVEEQSYKNTEIYNSVEFQNLIQGLESDIEDLKNDDLLLHLGSHDELSDDDISILLTFLTDRFDRLVFTDRSAEFDAFVNKYVAEDSEDSISKKLADKFKDIFKEDDTKSKNLLMTSEKQINTMQSSSTGYIIQEALIKICTAVFVLAWLTGGLVLGGLFEAICYLILSIPVYFGAAAIVISNVIGDVIGSMLEVFISAFYILAGTFFSLFQIAAMLGIIGLAIYAVGFYYNLLLLPIEYFICLIIAFFNYGGLDLSDALYNIGKLKRAILDQAVVRARAIYDSLTPFGAGYHHKISLLIQRGFLSKFFDRFFFLKKLVPFLTQIRRCHV